MKNRISPKKALLMIVISVIALMLLLGIINHLLYSVSSSTSPVVTGQSVIADDVPKAPEVSSKKDLDAAIETLDSMDLNSSEDTEELDYRLDAF